MESRENLHSPEQETSKERIDFFNSVKTNLIDIYPFKEGEREIVQQELDNLAKSITTDENENIVDKLRKVILKLDNSHTLLEKKNKGSRFFAAEKIKRIEDKYMLQEGNELHEIDTINGEDINILLNELAQDTPGGTEEYKEEVALIRLLSSNNPKSINVAYKDDHEVKEISFVEQDKLSSKDFVDSEMHGNVGILNINSWQKNIDFEGKGITDLIEEELSKLQNSESIIIDVRENGGGDSNVAMQLAGRFVDKEFYYSICQERIAGQNEYNETKQKLEPTGETLNQSLVILTSPKCLSSNEMFIASLKDTGRAITIGQRTGGGSGKPKTIDLTLGGEEYVLKISTWRQYRLNRQEIENQGIEPDIEVHQTIEDLNAGKDTVLEKALEYLSKEK